MEGNLEEMYFITKVKMTSDKMAGDSRGKSDVCCTVNVNRQGLRLASDSHGLCLIASRVCG